MTSRTERLRARSLASAPAISSERAVLMTRFYREHDGSCSPPVMRARAFEYLCEHKTIYLGEGELIVGERGPAPKIVPTFPELTCHSLQDLRILNERPKTSYAVTPEVFADYETTVIPYWRGRSMRDRLFAELPQEWRDAYSAGLFTEFMEQRAPGHTVLDDKIYRRGLLDFKRDIAAYRASLYGKSLDLTWYERALSLERRGSLPPQVKCFPGLDADAGGDVGARDQQLQAMDVACDAVIRFAARHAELAEAQAANEQHPGQRLELLRIAAVCRRVPAHAPRNFWEALQAYWFCHLGVITELNGWDAFNPGHLDQHLWPFYQRGIEDGSLTPEAARELLECFFIKFNNHPAPPKVGVTAAESGTYTDFANINLGGVLANGQDGSNPLTHVLLDIIDEMHLLQPSSNLQVSSVTPDDVLAHALRVIRRGYGFPSLFNCDLVVEELLRQGKTIEDARAGGCSGCVETGAFGKEAYILTGYLNLPKILELALHGGFDPRTGRQVGARTSPAAELTALDDLLVAFERQLRHVIDVKISGNQLIGEMYARAMPAPFLSVLIDDCISQGRDYNDGGARYNTSYIQGVGIGSITDSLAAIQAVVLDERRITLPALVHALDVDFADHEPLRQRLVHKPPKYGNDDDRADRVMRRVFEGFFAAVDDRPAPRGGRYRIQMLPTTCHVYFGSVTGASADGRRAGHPLSEGISPVQGADGRGPTAVLLSAAKMDHSRTGGTLLNMKFTPALLADEEGIGHVAELVRTYFRLKGHHVQFNVVDATTLREAQQHPDEHRGLIVRVAGYSDYFCDLSVALQDEIISRTAHE